MIGGSLPPLNMNQFEKNLTEYQRNLTESLKTARGKEYMRFYRLVFENLSEDIRIDATAIVENHHKFTAVNIAEIAIKYNLGFKPCCEFLETLKILPQGTYDRLKFQTGFKVGNIFAVAKKKISQQEKINAISTNSNNNRQRRKHHRARD